MKTKLKVLLAGRSKMAIKILKGHLAAQNRLDVELRHIVNGHADPLYGLEDLPDMLVLHINGLEGGEIEALIERPASMRPPMVVVSETDDAAVMRLAMKAGARDFLPQSEASNLSDSVDAICDDLASASTHKGELIAVVNAKGGSGATFLAREPHSAGGVEFGRGAALHRCGGGVRESAGDVWQTVVNAAGDSVSVGRVAYGSGDVAGVDPSDGVAFGSATSHGSERSGEHVQLPGEPVVLRGGRPGHAGVWGDGVFAAHAV